MSAQFSINNFFHIITFEINNWKFVLNCCCNKDYLVIVVDVVKIEFMQAIKNDI